MRFGPQYSNYPRLMPSRTWSADERAGCTCADLHRAVLGIRSRVFRGGPDRASPDARAASQCESLRGQTGEQTGLGYTGKILDRLEGCSERHEAEHSTLLATVAVRKALDSLFSANPAVQYARKNMCHIRHPLFRTQIAKQIAISEVTTLPRGCGFARVFAPNPMVAGANSAPAINSEIRDRRSFAGPFFIISAVPCSPRHEALRRNEGKEYLRSLKVRFSWTYSIW